MLPCPFLHLRVCSNSCPLSSDAIQPSHLLLLSSPLAFNLSQHQDVFQRVSSFYQVFKVLEFQLQCQSFQWIFRVDFFRIDWFDLLAIQGTLKSLLQHHSSTASILQGSALSIVQLSYPYITTGNTISLTIWTFVGKLMSQHFNMLPRFVIEFLPSNKCVFISWLQSLFAVILESKKIVCHCFHLLPIYLP